MTLYGYWRSSASYRVRIALAMKGIEVKHVAVNLRDGAQNEAAHFARNPQGYLPVLELEDGTKLTQSLAILDYLDAIVPDPALMPSDAVLRSKVLAASLVIASDISPIQNLSVLKYIRSDYGADDEGVTKWVRHWIAKGFNALEEIAETRTSKFLYMDEPGFFEVCLVPQVYNARRFGVNMDAFPHLSAIDAACRARPEFAIAAPEMQPDAM
ncbi:maleylacetoacetate isomerase [Robiginitomaculum antarcticum]|uniref:maleylacetoacetate isomerase n=1 Tax=Robiginitomaculum antarcticum TaxID=437507 RepID=UPI000476C02C